MGATGAGCAGDGGMAEVLLPLSQGHAGLPALSVPGQLAPRAQHLLMGTSAHPPPPLLLPSYRAPQTSAPPPLADVAGLTWSSQKPKLPSLLV